MRRVAKGTMAAGTALVIMALLAGCSAETPSSSDPTALQPLQSLDVQRYMGTWYEIAKYPNAFQKDCVANTTADYRLDDGGRLHVLNRCQKADGSMDEASAVGRHTGNAEDATFEVRFAPAWLSWLPAVWGDYWVIDIDEGYSLAAVSEPSRTYLWILSRTPTVDPAAYDGLLKKLKTQGFDVSKLERTKQQKPKNP